MKPQITKESVYLTIISAFLFSILCYDALKQNDLKCFIGFLIIGVCMTILSLYTDNITNCYNLKNESNNNHHTNLHCIKHNSM